MLTQEQLEYFKTHYSDMANKELAEKLGISPNTATAYGHKFGLRKSKEHIAKMQRIASQAGAEHVRLFGFSEEHKRKLMQCSTCHRFKKGQNIRVKIGAERDDERIAKVTSSRNRTLASERRRLLFGLPQRTKLNVVIVKQTSTKISIRYRMRKHGYIEDRDNHIFYRPKDVPPRPKAEKIMINKYKYKIIEKDL